MTEPRGLEGYLAGEWDGPGGALTQTTWDPASWLRLIWPDAAPPPRSDAELKARAGEVIERAR
jgi:hypothetical protein